MTAEDNKSLLQDAFLRLAEGDGRGLIDLMADEFTWEITGTTAWSRAYRGRETVRRDLFGPLFAQFAGRYRNRATRFVAEGDVVVVECRGEVTTQRGDSYDNTYCYVCRFVEGRLVELTEYLDTALVERVLLPPPSAVA